MIKNIKASVRQKGKFWHTVVTYTEDGVRQESWKSTGLPIANNKRRAQALAEERAAAFSEEAEERNRMESWGADSSIRDMLFADLIQQWYQRKALYISQSTQDGYLRILRYADPYFRKKGLTVQQVTQAHIQKYLSSLQEGRAKPLSNNTIKKHLVLLKSVFNEAIKDGTVTFNPARRVAQPKPVPYQAQTYSAEELHNLFHMLEGNDIHDIVLVTAFYGLRRSEACGLRWQDVDFEQNILFIRHKVLQTHLNGTFQVTQTNELKTEASRRAFTLTPTIRELLLNRRTRADNNRKQWGNCYNHDFDEYVFTLENGDLLTPDKVSNRFRAFIQRKGLKKIRYHDLRHSCATLLLHEGFTLQQIQVYLGHATFQTTLRYAHLDASTKTAASNEMEQLLGTKKCLNLAVTKMNGQKAFEGGLREICEKLSENIHIFGHCID